MSGVDNAYSLMMSMAQGRQRLRALPPGMLRRIWRFSRSRRPMLYGFLALSTVSAGIAVGIPLLVGRVVDAIFAREGAGPIITIALVMAGLAVVDAGITLAERWLSARVGEGLISDLRRAVFSHVQSMSLAFFTRTRTGALVSRLNNDVIAAQRAFTTTLSGLVTNVIQLVLTLVVMVTLAWQVTLLALVLLPVFILPARRMGRRIAELSRESADLNAAMTGQMTERFSAGGATLVKLFGRPRAEAEEFGARADRVRAIGVRTAMANRVFLTGLTLVSALAQALVYGLGGYLAYTGSIAPGTVVSLGFLLTRLYTPLTSLSNARVDVMSALVSFERVFEVLDLRPRLVEPADPTPLPADRALGVRMRAVRFTYPDAAAVSLASLEEVAVLDTTENREVLHGVDLEVAPGRMLALVGTSGAGKSTIASLVPRLYDVDSGAIELGGGTGTWTDVRDLAFDDLRGAVGVVTQDGHLFHDTVRANLRYASPEATDEDLVAALRRARLGDLYDRLPDGLDTVVGERGHRLSGGERQRLTIARLLLAAPRVVILDEATAHLDSESEAAVQEALTEALVGRTAIVIAHRLSTIRSADTIAVVEDGRVVEQGSHASLLAQQGRYADLHHTQFAVLRPTA